MKTCGIKIIPEGSGPSKLLGLVCLLGILLCANFSHAAGESISTTRHNLSVGGQPGGIKAATENQVCIFCHTPHNGLSEAPLWNRYSSGATYIPYSSTTVKATIGQPTGSSKLCLSCHDGTVALGMVVSQTSQILFEGGITVLPSGATRLATDLSDDHPISFIYDTALATMNGELNDPSQLTGPVLLENGQVQCTSCHDPHSDPFGKFLVLDNQASALCVTCHQKNYWLSSTHQLSSATWNGAGTDPWPHTEQVTVASNACENCHRPHSAGTTPRLLNFAGEEQNCYSCHNGNVGGKNVESEFNKLSIHPVAFTTGVHDPTEDILNPARHVECVDCHNPHAVNALTASPPQATGALAGTIGIDSGGSPTNPITDQYELCFRCHADSLDRGPANLPRQFAQTNTRLEFFPPGGNASYHPVGSVGRNLDVPSLINPYTTSSLIYCTDCHNNNQGPGAGSSGPNGPHGSSYTPILERQLVLTDFSQESSSIYALCYKCHSRSNLLADGSFKKHEEHIEAKTTSCTTCHDPHGSPLPHLINFNLNYVTPSSKNGRLEFVDGPGLFEGRCSLTCHGQDHDDWDYKP